MFPSFVPVFVDGYFGFSVMNSFSYTISVLVLFLYIYISYICMCIFLLSPADKTWFQMLILF